jgi:hypothetical protein
MWIVILVWRACQVLRHLTRPAASAWTLEKQVEGKLRHCGKR